MYNGTGSNCSYFDGKGLDQSVKSLGYTLMDEASGNYYGKELIRDYYFKIDAGKPFGWHLNINIILKLIS
jgi:N-acetylglucosamine kinase-like BadF-type ATPase